MKIWCICVTRFHRLHSTGQWHYPTALLRDLAAVVLGGGGGVLEMDAQSRSNDKIKYDSPSSSSLCTAIPTDQRRYRADLRVTESSANVASFPCDRCLSLVPCFSFCCCSCGRGGVPRGSEELGRYGRRGGHRGHASGELQLPRGGDGLRGLRQGLFHRNEVKMWFCFENTHLSVLFSNVVLDAIFWF